MAQRRDDSMLFSLNGLFGIEKERVERELRAHRLAAEAAAARAEAREQAKREAELERQRLAAESARQEAQRRREDEIRLAAFAQAALENARTESAARARFEVLEKQHEHERRMTALTGGGQRGGQLAAAGLGVAVLCMTASLGLYFGKLRPDTQRVQRAYDELVSVEHARAEETKRILDRTEKRRAELATELEAARQRITALESAQKAPTLGSAPARPKASALDPGGKEPRPTGCVDDGDPMNKCL